MILLNDPQTMQDMYPSDRANEAYLEGVNWDLEVPARSVLWFEMDGDSFKQHNWGPEDPQGDCNSDLFVWEDTLLYLGTTTVCDGQDVSTLYDPGIAYMPADFTDEWYLCGRSEVTHSEFGEVVREGSSYWCSQVSKTGDTYVVEVSIHTDWDDGWPTDWVEELTMTEEDGLLSHSGGNLDGSFTWNVEFIKWSNNG